MEAEMPTIDENPYKTIPPHFLQLVQENAP